MKRLAKLAGPTPSPSPGPSTSKPATPPPPTPTPVLKPIPKPSVSTNTPATTSTTAHARKPPQGPAKLDLPTWEHDVVGFVLRVTLDVRNNIYYVDFAISKFIFSVIMPKRRIGSRSG